MDKKKIKNKIIMKIKLLLILLLISFTTFSQKTDNITLNIVLRPIQTITINPAQKDVKLIYDTKDKYGNGVSREYADHIEVFSTGGFKINVKGEGDLTNNGSESIPLSDVSITASNGTKVTSTSTYVNVNLSTDDALLIYSSSGGRDLKYNITYNNLVTEDKYIDKYFSSDNDQSVYKTNLTYTITPL